MFDWIHILQEYKQKYEPVTLVTVTKVLGSAPCVVGSRMIVVNADKVHGTVGGGKMEFQVIDKALDVLFANQTEVVEYILGPEYEQCCGGKVELLIEPMNKLPELFLFGAGHIGVEISNLLVGTPFQVNLIDSRKDWFAKLALAPEVKTKEVQVEDFKTFSDVVRWGDNCYVLVLTHDHTIDFDIIAMAIPKKTKYLGLIGSKTKAVRFNNMLINEMEIAEGMKNVVCPIGLKIGGSTPKEIAISVVAELLQVHYSDTNK
ncbi:xanthine dehydrogenase accessory protein XdhC [Cellulophaga baltica]|uniref:xanthine dehydrogenase accessory protein XdhC n=1 Tax=Cellulophaga TaxID=104264 RepID=UPI001C06CEF0|nr:MULTISPECIES: xanthine dehydrogenase accessory protein XdhC [Cellulophaga]MBU2996628.1 xanthine dehydrogenase accessory protein XdhC [Cellulophaga baltica]MDO6768022.1 xanthine dehydrogenase accessory protein XdhC [Cellulophaga sp. 1_MG-2023]